MRTQMPEKLQSAKQIVRSVHRIIAKLIRFQNLDTQRQRVPANGGANGSFTRTRLNAIARTPSLQPNRGGLQARLYCPSTHRYLRQGINVTACTCAGGIAANKDLQAQPTVGLAAACSLARERYLPCRQV
jgi:hypothetical protein